MNIIECYTIKLLCQRSVFPGFLKPLQPMKTWVVKKILN